LRGQSGVGIVVANLMLRKERILYDSG
jgi:hypothetical protein